MPGVQDKGARGREGGGRKEGWSEGDRGGREATSGGESHWAACARFCRHLFLLWLVLSRLCNNDLLKVVNKSVMDIKLIL